MKSSTGWEGVETGLRLAFLGLRQVLRPCLVAMVDPLQPRPSTQAQWTIAGSCDGKTDPNPWSIPPSDENSRSAVAFRAARVALASAWLTSEVNIPETNLRNQSQEWQQVGSNRLYFHKTTCQQSVGRWFAAVFFKVFLRQHLFDSQKTGRCKLGGTPLSAPMAGRGGTVAGEFH